jgi:hypothetical protein
VMGAGIRKCCIPQVPASPACPDHAGAGEHTTAADGDLSPPALAR